MLNSESVTINIEYEFQPNSEEIDEQTIESIFKNEPPSEALSLLSQSSRNAWKECRTNIHIED